MRRISKNMATPTEFILALLETIVFSYTALPSDILVLSHYTTYRINISCRFSKPKNLQDEL